MTRSQAERTGLRLLDAIPSALDPTERGLIDLALSERWTFYGVEVTRADVGMGLRWLKRRGLAFKLDRPWNRRRPDRGNGWQLTDEGYLKLREIDERRERYRALGESSRRDS